jgi:hypothetical protein
MWALSVISPTALTFFVHAVFVSGIVLLLLGLLTSKIPTIAPYGFLIKIVGVVLFLFGLYFEGGLQNELAWRAKIAEMEQKVAVVEEKSKEENVKIVTKVVTKTEVVRERGQDVIKYVDREVTKYDTKFLPGGQCEIPKEFIKSLNDAAEQSK